MESESLYAAWLRRFSFHLPTKRPRNPKPSNIAVDPPSGTTRIGSAQDRINWS